MPAIRTYDAGNLALQPTEIGIQSVAGAARQIGAFARQQAEGVTAAGHLLAHDVGEGIAAAGKAAVDYQTHQQISRGEAATSTLLEQATDAWKRYQNGADLNDPAVAQRFNDEWLQPRLEKLRESFTTD